MFTVWTFPFVIAQSLSIATSEVPATTIMSTPLPSQRTDDATQWSKREEAQNRAFFKFREARMRADPDARLLALLEKKRQLEMSLPAIAHRQPFDALALKSAYGDLARVIGEMNARNAELVVEQLATLSPEERGLVIERIPYLATPIVAMPPPPSSK